VTIVDDVGEAVYSRKTAIGGIDGVTRHCINYHRAIATLGHRSNRQAVVFRVGVVAAYRHRHRVTFNHRGSIVIRYWRVVSRINTNSDGAGSSAAFPVIDGDYKAVAAGIICVGGINEAASSRV